MGRGDAVVSAEVSGEVVDARHPVRGPVRLGPALALVAVLCAVASGLLLVTVTANAGQVLLALFFAAMVATLVLGLAGVLAAALPSRRHHLRVATRDDGLEVVGSPWIERSGVVLAPVLVVLSGVMVVMAVRSDEGPLDVWIPTVLMLLLTGFVAWTAQRYLSGHRPVDGFTLRRQGFTVRLRGSAEEFGWGDVIGFRMGWRGVTVVVLGHAGTTVPCWALGLRSDPALVAALLEFYRSHERERSELANGRALERARAGTFLAPAQTQNPRPPLQSPNISR